MVLFVANIVAIAVMGFLVARHRRERAAASTGWAHGLRIAALVPLGVQMAVFIAFGIDALASGDINGVGHLLQTALVAALTLLVWRRPLEGGVALFIIGAVTSLSLSQSAAPGFARMILTAPQTASGVLFFIAALLSQRETTPRAS